MRSIYKNLILYLLVFIMLISNISISYAVESNTNNKDNQSNNLGGGGDFSTSAKKFGYRVSLISKSDPEEILSVNETGEKIVYDFWFCSEAQFNQYCFTNAITDLTAENVHSAIKTQTLYTQNKLHRFFIPDEIANRGSESILSQIPSWIGYEGGKWVTYGKRLQDWETANEYENIARMATELDYKGADGKVHLYFQTKDTMNKYSDDGKPLSVLSKDIESNKDIVLLIEPLLLFTPCYYGTSIPLGMTKQYGTVTNIIESMWDNPTFQKEYSKNKRFNHLNYQLTDVCWDALNLKVDEYFEFDNGFRMSKFVLNATQQELSGHLNWSALNETRDWTFFNGFGASYKNGYAANIFWLDGVLRVKIDTGNPPVSESGSNQFILNRFFRKKNKDNTYTYEKYDTHKYDINKDRNVLINSSADDYSLVEYNTSETESLVPSKATDYDGFKAKSTGSIQGTTSTEIEIKNDTKIKTINVLYEKSKQTKVIKVYEENGETVKVTNPEVITTKEYEVKKEDGYEYTENKKSDKPAKSITDWEDTEGSRGTDEKIIIDESTETIYILYQKSDVKQIKLFSNELSYTYELKDLVKSRILFSIYDTVPKSPGTSPRCGGHGKKGRKCSLKSHAMVDSLWSVKVSNNYDYNSTSFIREYSNEGNLGGRWSTGISGKSITANSSQVAKPGGIFLLIRDNVDDIVTLYPHKNNNLLSSLNGLGITTESYTPSQSRVETEAIKDKDFTRTFETDFIYTEHDTSLSWKWPRSKCNRDHGGSYSTQTVTDVSGANKYYSNSNNVKEYYLLGQANQGTEEATDMRSDSFSKYSYNKAYSSTSADLKFYPYHLMLYRAKNSNANAQNVYVTSENLSTMKVYNAVQLGVYKKNPINALLSSTQWSTHARSLAFSGNTDKKSVIPGGGILDISMGSKGDTELGIRLWQSCLRDEMVETVQTDSFNTSLSKAKEIANNYQSEVKQVLEGYGLVQYGIEGTKTDLNSVLSGTELHNNTNLAWDNRNYKSSNDSKYYLKHDATGSDRANFDVLDTKITKQVFYEISSDVDGNVILKKDNTEIARASLNQDKSAILSNTEAKLLDDNTKLITNFFSSIDRGLGDRDKYDRTNSRKYNEAYDGVGVLLTELSFSVGFSDNSGHRTTVLDTLLTSTAESKSELYDFTDENKIRSFVFATRKTSSTTENTKSGYLGTLQGDSNMQSLQSVLSDIQSFVYSKNFYTSNFNVTDLN